MSTTATAVEWGVRWAGSVDRDTHVDVRLDEAAARRWHRAIRFGGVVAEVVTRTDGGDWQPAGEVLRG